jgi:hypothetical protein
MSLNMPYIPSASNIKDPGAKRWAEELAKTLDKYHSDVNNILRFRTLKIGNPDPNTNTYFKIDEDGNSYWVGDGTGIPYGNMWNHDVGTAVTPSGIGTPTQIPSGFTVGKTNLVTFQNSRELAVAKAGIYGAVWNISFTAGAANQEVEGCIMVDASCVSSTDGGSAHRKISTGTDTGNMGAPTYLDLAADEVVSLAIINETSTNTITIEHANLIIWMVGGT